MYRIEAMRPEHARMISGWKYPGEYGIYSFEPSAGLTNELLDGSYFACTDELGRLIGFFCFGVSAQIPTSGGYVYSADFLDVGLGLAPDFCGRGLGPDFLRAGLDFACRELGGSAFRLTVACFNRRAICVYERLDFRVVAEVTHQHSGMRFQIMARAGKEDSLC